LEDEPNFQSRNKAAARDQTCRSEDRSSQEGGDDGNLPATHNPHINEEEEALDLRTNPFQERWDDDRGPSPSPNISSSFSSSPTHRRSGPTKHHWMSLVVITFE